MRSAGGAGFSRPVLVLSALLAFLLAGAADLTATESPLHALTLASVTTTVVALRVRFAHQRRLLQWITAIVTVQPALHAAVKLAPHGSLSHGAESAAVSGVDLTVSATQIVLAAAVVGALCLVEHLVALLSKAILAWIVVRRSVPPQHRPVRQRSDSRPAGRPRPCRRGTEPRRGPPLLTVATT